MVAKNQAKSKEKNSRIYDAIIIGSLMVLAAGLPLFFMNNTVQGIGLEKQYFFYAFLFIAIIAWVVKSAIQGELLIRKHPLHRFVLLFFLVLGVSVIFSVDRYHSIVGVLGIPTQGLISMISLGLLYFVITTHFNRSLVQRLFWIIVISGAVVILWSILGFLGLLPQILSVNVIGSFRGLSMYTVALIPLFIVAFAQLKSTQKSTVKNMVGMVFFGVIIAIALGELYAFLFAYTEWKLLLGGLAFFLTIALAHIVKIPRAATIMAVATFVFVAGFLIVGELSQRFVQLPVEGGLVYKQSMILAKDAISAKPLLGTGLGTFGYNFSLYRPDQLVQQYGTQLRLFTPTGALFGFATTTGIVGFFGFFMLVMMSMYYGFRTFLQRSKDSDLLTVGLASSSFMILVYALFAPVDSSIIIFGILLGSLYLAYISKDTSNANDFYKFSFSREPKYALPLAFTAIIFVVGMIYVGVTAGKVLIADISMKQALIASNGADISKMTNHVRSAIVNAPQEGQYGSIMAQQFLRQANADIALPESERDMQKIENAIHSAVQMAEYGVQKNPNIVTAWEVRGFIYENSGGFYDNALEEAHKSYQRAQELDPKNASYLVAFSRLKFIEAQGITDDVESAQEKRISLVEEARDFAKQSIERKANFSAGYDQLSIMEEVLGNLDEAIVAADSALRTSSRNFGFASHLAYLYQQRGDDNDLALAERLLQSIIGVNDADLNARISLALLYERVNQFDRAGDEYQKVYDLFEDKESDQVKAVKKLLDTVRAGKSNIQEGIQTTQSNSNEEEAESNDVAVDISTMRVSILDGGNNEDGFIETIASFLTSNSVSVPTVGVAKKQSYKGIKIFYKKDFTAQSKELAAMFEENYDNTVSRKQDNTVTDNNDADIVIVVGVGVRENNTNENDDKGNVPIVDDTSINSVQ